MNKLNCYSKWILHAVTAVFLLTGCQSFEKRLETTPAATKKSNPSQVPVAPTHNSEYTQVNPNVEVDDNSKEEPDEQNIKPRPLPDIPKIGIILGPGGSRVYGEIGVLQEFQKNKIPIHSIAGMELGSLVGSLYAWRNSVNDVEWQMFKLKEEDLFKKSLLTGKKTADITSLNPIIKAAFHNLKKTTKK
jgi:NTE family protein